MTDINFKVSARNAHILRRVRDKYGNVSRMCRASGICQSAAGNLLNMKASPYRKDGNLTAAAMGICEALNATPQLLWPGNMADLKIKKSSTEFEIAEHDVAMISDPETRAIQRQLIAKWAKSLRPREIDIIGRRQAGETYEEIGRDVGITRERVRQIEVRAMRRIRTAAHRDGIRSISAI